MSDNTEPAMPILLVMVFMTIAVMGVAATLLLNDLSWAGGGLLVLGGLMTLICMGVLAGWAKR